jgi:hypothetical protein
MSRLSHRIATRFLAENSKSAIVSSNMEAIFMGVEFPVDMDKQEAIDRAKALIPCEVGDCEVDDSGPGWIAGNFYCEEGFYENNPDGDSYGPDDAGVKVVWETP